MNIPVATAVVAAFLSLAGPVHAGMIAIASSLTATVSEATVIATVTITNNGNEPARSVQTTVTLLGHTESSEPVSELDGKTSYTRRFSLPLPSLPGTYPIVAHTDYSDARGRRFSAPVVSHCFLGGPSPALGIMFTNGDADHITLTKPNHRTALLIINHSGRTIKSTVSVIHPRNILVKPNRLDITIEGNGRQRIPIDIENISLPPGSESVLTILAEHPVGGLSTLAMQSITITTKGSIASFRIPAKIFFAAAFITLVLIVALTLGQRPSLRR